jgi:hypothetical protein
MINLCLVFRNLAKGLPFSAGGGLGFLAGVVQCSHNRNYGECKHA